MFISLDDAVSYWGIRKVFGAELKVPNLDWICAQAVAFQAAYCQAPVCGPSRASFMSGRTPQETGVFDNSLSVFDTLPVDQMWSTRLKAAGYFCSSGGKVHHGYKPLSRTRQAALYSDGRKVFLPDMSLPPDAKAQKFGGHRGGWATTDPADDATYYDHQSADSAIDFLQTYDGEAPFYREVGFFSPHGPHITPARFKEMYKLGSFWRPAAWEKGFACDEGIPELAKIPPRIADGQLRYWRQCLRNYFAAYSHGDHHLGRVWKALKASRHAENTLVVICADHGFHLGDRGRFTKFTLFEQTTKVPLILHDPSRPAAAGVVSDPVALLDLGPTVLDWAGVPAPADWAGRSLLPMLDGQRDPDRVVFSVWDQGIAIRKGDYRLIRYHSGRSQLFDVVHDRWDQNDLGPQHPAYAAMQEAVDQVLARHGAPKAAATAQTEAEEQAV
ncbi:sulfatase [Rhodobacter sp.]